MRFTFIFLLLISSFYSFSQSLSDTDIRKLANQINDQVKNVDLGNGVTARGCLSSGRTLIYQYDVPDNWQAPENIKEEVISNLKATEAAKTYFLQSINVDFFYYKSNSLVKKVSVKANEFSTYNYKLGNYLSIKDHPKSKGVNLKLKVPKDWEINEGDRPNIVKKFEKDGNTYLILIKENMTFFSRKEIKEIFQDNNSLLEFVQESSSIMNEPKILEQSLVTIDTYPTIQFKVKGTMERSGLRLPTIMRCWGIFYEDKIIFLQSFGFTNAEFTALEQLYFLITNSVIFPEQYY